MARSIKIQRHSSSPTGLSRGCAKPIVDHAREKSAKRQGEQRTSSRTLPAISRPWSPDAGDFAAITRACPVALRIAGSFRRRSRTRCAHCASPTRQLWFNLASACPAVRLGVALADALVERGYVLLGQDGGIVTAPGEAFFADFSIELHQHGHGKREVLSRFWRGDISDGSLPPETQVRTSEAQGAGQCLRLPPSHLWLAV